MWPNDDVNMTKAAMIHSYCYMSECNVWYGRVLFPGLDLLIDEIDKKSKKIKGKLKTGRTHLMDAMPIDFSQELSGWSAQLKSCRALKQANKRMLELPQGGTAIEQVNAHKDFPKNFCSTVEKHRLKVKLQVSKVLALKIILLNCQVQSKTFPSCNENMQ